MGLELVRASLDRATYLSLVFGCVFFLCSQCRVDRQHSVLSVLIKI